MSAQDKACVKCGGPLEEGFIGDFTDGTVKQSTWFEGKATDEYGFGLRVEHRGRLPIEVFRCTGCGFLEMYAPEHTIE